MTTISSVWEGHQKRVATRRQRQFLQFLPLLVGLALACLLLIMLHNHTLDQQRQKERGVRISSSFHYSNSSLQEHQQQLVASLFKRDYERGRRLLSDMVSIRRANSHILPLESYFGNHKQRHKNFSEEEELCTGKDEGSCVGKFGRGLLSTYVVAPEYKVVGCLLRKSMSTLLRAIFCFLRDEENIRSTGTSLFYLGYVRHQPKMKMCQKTDGGMYSTKGSTDAIRELLSPYRENLLAVVREPIGRFLSAFLDKCIRSPQRRRVGVIPCNGCGSNLTCFIIAEYHRMKEFESATSQLSDSQLQQFDDTGEDRHLFPQNWQCDFKNLLSRYSLIHHSSLGESRGEMQRAKSENFQAKLVDYLKSVGVGAESLAYIRHLEKDTTHHVTHDTEARRFLEQRLRGSPFLMEFLVRMFYWDFRLLGFPLPRLHWGRGKVNSGLPITRED